MTLLATSVAVPAWAQVVTLSGANTKQESRATPDQMVARLMSFDANHDGRLARNELPERMQGLFARVDTIKKDNVLDAAEVRSLAERPGPQIVIRGFEPGHYGFGNGFEFDDTRLHINGAVDDLRLAAGTREKVFGIIREFQEATQARTTSDLMAGMAKILTSAQLADFKDAIANERVRSVPALQSGNVLVFGATPEEIAGQRLVMTPLKLATGVDPLTQIADYGLNAEQQSAARAVIEEYQLRKVGRFSDADRTALVSQLKGVLDDQQRDDLRAALERRPILKQGTVAQVSGAVILEQLQRNQLVQPRQQPNPAPTFGLQDLVLR
jgi:hypothetical protein